MGEHVSAGSKRKHDTPDLIALCERVARLEESNAWIKRKLEVIDRRTWYVLASVVVFGVVSIIIAVAGRVL